MGGMSKAIKGEQKEFWVMVTVEYFGYGGDYPWPYLR